MIKIFSNLPFVKRIFSRTEIPRPLGRWSLVDDRKTAHRRSELANEDHCGTCATYALRQSEKNIQKIHVPNLKNKK